MPVFQLHLAIKSLVILQPLYSFNKLYIHILLLFPICLTVLSSIMYFMLLTNSSLYSYTFMTYHTLYYIYDFFFFFSAFFLFTKHSLKKNPATYFNQFFVSFKYSFEICLETVSVSPSQTHAHPDFYSETIPSPAQELQAQASSLS